MTELNLTNLIAGQMTGYELYNNQFDVTNLKKISYVTAANGLFRVEKTPVALFKTKISEVKKSIPGLNEMVEGPELLIPKIPFKYLQQALSFYRDVNKKDRTEASLLFFWNEHDKVLPTQYSDNTPIKGLYTDGKLVVYVPKQVNSSTLSEFHMDPAVTWFRDNLSILCETHSHNTMDAFFSGTDNANENASQFYGVWGKVDKDIPAFAFRYCSGDAKIEVGPEVLFDWPVYTTEITYHTTCSIEGFEPIIQSETSYELYPGPFSALEYPGDWMEQHSKKSYVSNWNKTTPSTPSNAPKSYLAGNDGALEEIIRRRDELLPFDGTESCEFDDFGQIIWQKEGGFSEEEDYEVRSLSAITKAEVTHLFDEKDQLALAQMDIEQMTHDYYNLGFGRIIEDAIDSANAFK